MVKLSDGELPNKKMMFLSGQVPSEITSNMAWLLKRLVETLAYMLESTMTENIMVSSQPTNSKFGNQYMTLIYRDHILNYTYNS